MEPLSRGNNDAEGAADAATEYGGLPNDGARPGLFCVYWVTVVSQDGPNYPSHIQGCLGAAS